MHGISSYPRMDLRFMFIHVQSCAQNLKSFSVRGAYEGVSATFPDCIALTRASSSITEREDMSIFSEDLISDGRYRVRVQY